MTDYHKMVNKTNMRVFRDQMQRKVLVKGAQRIVSLVPSQTELLLDLGLEERLVGRTKFCIHPQEKVQRIAVVGGTKTVHIEKVASLQPDLLLGNKEENTKEDIEGLEKAYPVWMSDIHTLSDAYRMIQHVGMLTHTEDKTQELQARIRKNMDTIRGICAGTVLYLIWRRPWRSVGGDTFISHMLEHVGFSNVLKQHKRYPALSDEELQALRPHYVFLSSEPYPFTDKHKKELRPLLRDAYYLCVDGAAFSWYGSRLEHFSASVKKIDQQLSGA